MSPRTEAENATTDDARPNCSSTVSNSTTAATTTTISLAPSSACAATSHRIAITLPVLVFLDMLGVALVVPLLHQYYAAAGISDARQRELLSSLFSSAQIVGGLAIGALSDSGLLSRRDTLMLSFGGSAASYALIVKGTVPALVFGRVLVGLVKQTMTVTTGLLARHTGKEERATQMGRLTAASTAAWIVGPSFGGFLYKNVGPAAPALASCAIFIVNAAIAAAFLPRSDDDNTNTTESEKSNRKSDGTAKAGKFASFASNLRCCFTSTTLASVILSTLLFSWVSRATSYARMASYYEDLYGIEPHQRGYLTSYQQTLGLIIQSFLVKPILRVAGGERRAACLAAAAMAIATFGELWASFRVFAGVICPVVSVSTAVLLLSLKSLVTQVAPKDSLGSVLAALDVLQNAASVTVPFYRTVLFSVLERLGGVSDNGDDDTHLMRGDPDPYLWLKSSALHWTVAAAVFVVLLLRGQHHRTFSESEKIKKVL